MNNKIPIFDSLTHPTPNGDWIMKNCKNTNTIKHLLKKSKKYNIQWSFVVNLDLSKNYIYSSYFKKYKNLFPIFFFDINQFESLKDIENTFSSLKNNGYYGIKIHSRISKNTITNKKLIKSINIAKKFNLIIMICTYFHSNEKNSFKNNTISLHKLLIKTNGAKIILLHGGLTNILTYMDIIKPFNNVILDLSYTFIKYKESSLDKDFEYLFKHFDRRICIGSDSPDFTIKDLRKRFNDFHKLNINNKKLENIAYKNLLSLLGVNIGI